jgi:hypothetical protein
MRQILCLLVLSLLPVVSFAQDSLVVDPDPGAFPIGTPQSLSYGAGTIRVSDFGPAGLQIQSPVGASPNWMMLIEPSTGQQLAVGCFERAKRFPDNGRPWVDFSFGSSGCNNAYGRFRVLDIQRNGLGDVTGLALDFAQQCAQFGRAVRGKIRFNTSVPTTGAHLRPITDQTGTFSFTAAPGAIGATAPGGTATFQLTRQNSDAKENFDNGVSIAYTGPLPGGSPTGFWSLDFAAPGEVPITPTSYPIATRYPFQSGNEAGLDFSYGGSGCNTSTGSFNVTDVAMDGLDPLPLRFSATFQQRCPDAAGPLTSGTVTFNNNVVGPTAPLPTGVLLVSGFEDGESGAPSYFVSSCE